MSTAVDQGEESSVNAASGTGSPIRTLTVTTLIDGTLTDVRMQVVTIADAEGKLIPLDGSQGILDLLGEIRDLIRLAIGG